MKANELMIGDWVVYDGDVEYTNPIKVEGIDIATGALVTSDREDVGIDNIQPIPLTAEILERNGFEIQDQGGGRRDVWIGFGVDCEGDIEVEFQYNIPTHLKIDGVFKGEYYTSTNIKYVHLLQHALRLCGIEKEIEL